MIDFGIGLVFYDDEGQYDHASGLECEFRFPISNQTQSFENVSTRWFTAAYDPDPAPWSEFAATIEGRQEFVALRDVRLQTASIGLVDV